MIDSEDSSMICDKYLCDDICDDRTIYLMRVSAYLE